MNKRDWNLQNKNKKYTFEDLKKVIFSDKARVSCLISYRPPLVRRKRNSSLQERHIIPTVKHPVSIMIWGFFSYHGLGKIEVIDGIVNHEKYTDILERRLIEYKDAKNLTKEDIIFQDDNAPCHRHKKVNEWFIKNQILRMEWPAQSPIINPIENIWHYFKMKIRNRLPKSKAELISIAKEVWQYNMCPQLIENLIKSMPNRMKKIIEARGGHINY